MHFKVNLQGNSLPYKLWSLRWVYRKFTLVIPNIALRDPTLSQTAFACTTTGRTRILCRQNKQPRNNGINKGKCMGANPAYPIGTEGLVEEIDGMRRPILNKTRINPWQYIEKARSLFKLFNTQGFPTDAWKRLTSAWVKSKSRLLENALFFFCIWMSLELILLLSVSVKNE